MKSQKGNAMVEMALVLPILILLLVGIIDFGRVFHVYLTIDHAGREAARVASVNPNIGDESLKEIAVEKSGGLITKLNVTVDTSDKARGSIATVTIRYPITFLTPIIQPFFPSSFTLSDTTKMRIE